MEWIKSSIGSGHGKQSTWCKEGIVNHLLWEAKLFMPVTLYTHKGSSYLCE